MRERGDTLPRSMKELIEEAKKAREKAVAPFSKYKVGAALRTAEGKVFHGCNVENASFPAGMCAERSALASAIARGFRVFELIVVATEAEEPTPPCGR